MDKSIALKWILDCGVIAIFRAASSAGLVEAAEAVHHARHLALGIFYGK